MRRSVILSSAVITLILILVLPAAVYCSSSGKMPVPDPALFDFGTDAVLVIDVSGSMKQSDPEYLCKKAALDFVRELSLSQDSRTGLVTFSDTLQTVIPLTRLDNEADADGSPIISELNSLTYTSGDTDIGLAMEKACELLGGEGIENGMENRSRNIFLLTDGEIDLPCAEDEEAAEKQSLTRALMAVENAKNENIVIHTAILDLSGEMDDNLMKYMAESTGGTESRIDNPAALEDVFKSLYAYAERQSRERAEAALKERMAETETETETEEETETETEQPLVVRASGSIDSPVHLKGIFPSLCSAELDLSELFCLEGNQGGGFTDSIRYTAYPEDNSLMSCKVTSGVLRIDGLKNGTGRVQIIAEPEDLSYADNPGSQASLSFQVTIDAVIPSLYYLALVPALAALIFIIVYWIRRQAARRTLLSGTLQWYVRGENEKIFGIPAQSSADLSGCGSRIRLSELIRDDLLADADTSRVSIMSIEEGIRVISRSASCLIAPAGGVPDRSLDITGTGRFKIFFETGAGRAVIIAMYTAEGEYKSEPSTEDDSEERTRMLV